MKFSVIIPYKDFIDTIEWCIQSVLSQNFDKNEFEVICVDNGSSDGSRMVVEKFSDRVRIVESDAKTVSGVRNDGAKVAKGEILAFLDSDCIAPAWWLREAEKNREKISGRRGMGWSGKGFSYRKQINGIME